jgi:glycosyltransferase involved in cell wall biosynthesis
MCGLGEFATTGSVGTAWGHAVSSKEVVRSALSIGYLSPGWPAEAFSNGIVTYIATLAPALQEMGLRVTVLAQQVAAQAVRAREEGRAWSGSGPRPGSPDTGVYDIGGTQATRGLARRIADGFLYRAAPQFAHRRTLRRWVLATVERAVAERGIQIIEMEESFGWARWVRESTCLPVCVRLHGPWFINGPALGVPDDRVFRDRVRAEGHALGVANVVTAPYRDVLDSVREFYGLALSEAEVIPNPIRPVPPVERWRYEQCDPKLVLFIGRFDRLKGGDLVVEAFARVLQDEPRARLCFVGSDEGYTDGNGRQWGLKDLVQARIPGALETGQIKWLGRQPLGALPQLRREAMVTVICSRAENFPYAVLEAMAPGCPMVAASVGGIPGILRDGVDALLHRVADPSDIAAKILRLLRDPAEATRLGRQAAASCEQRFYPEVVAGQLVELYQRTICRNAGSRRNRRERSLC